VTSTSSASFLNDKVKEVSAELGRISPRRFDDRYRTIVPRDDEDLGYTWGWFQSVRKLYRKAAERGRCVLFRVDQ
jgi:hypothetical protein